MEYIFERKIRIFMKIKEEFIMAGIIQIIYVF